MSFITTYKILFQFKIYHHYFLDDGRLPFDGDPDLTERQLGKYNFGDFCCIAPSEATERFFLGQKLLFKTDTTGFTIYVKAEETTPNSGSYKPFIALPQNSVLYFLIYVKDPLFENYSTVPSAPSLPFYFSNKKLETEASSFTYIDLIETTHPIEDFRMAPATWEQRESLLSNREKMGLFGIISLEMAGDNTTPVDGKARNILNVDGTVKASPKTFKVQIKNRSTVWNYRSAKNSELLHSSDPEKLPLVQNGIVGYRFNEMDWPAASPSLLLFEKDSGGSIVKTISEIYINQ